MTNKSQLARKAAYNIIISLQSRGFSPDLIRADLVEAGVWDDLSKCHKAEIDKILNRLRRDYYTPGLKGEEREEKRTSPFNQIPKQKGNINSVS